MQQALRARLLADAGVNAIAGNRIDWGWRIQGAALPAVTLLTISDPRPQHLKGFQPLRETRVQLDCWAETYGEARALAEAAIAAAVPEQSGNGIAFNRALVDGMEDRGEQTDTGFVHRTSIDLIVWWSTEE